MIWLPYLTRLHRVLTLLVLLLIGAAQAAFAQAPQSKFAEVNGVRLHYLVAGKGDPVVLLHGYAQTSHMWTAPVPQEFFRV